MDTSSQLILFDRHTPMGELEQMLPKMALFARLNQRKAATDESYRRISISLHEHSTPIGIENAIRMGAVIGIMLRRGRIAGMISFSPVRRKQKGEKKSSHVHENFICVHPTYGNKGISKQLRNAMIQWAHQQGHAHVQSNAITPHSFRGYQTLARDVQRATPLHPLHEIIHRFEFGSQTNEARHQVRIHLKPPKPAHARRK